eukprot:1191462-Prorocentrum_minimum.AAC.1
MLFLFDFLCGVPSGVWYRGCIHSSELCPYRDGGSRSPPTKLRLRYQGRVSYSHVLFDWCVRRATDGGRREARVRGVTKGLQRGCYKGVAKVLQRGYKWGVTKALQRCCKGVRKLLQRCYKGGVTERTGRRRAARGPRAPPQPPPQPPGPPTEEA